jgi:hypothetical protein
MPQTRSPPQCHAEHPIVADGLLGVVRTIGSLQKEAGQSFNNFGGLVKTTFKF